MTYPDLIEATGATQDVLLYILAAFVEVGLVEKISIPSGPGRPSISYRWIAPKARATRVRSA
jgi:hypothetical protein